MLCSFYVCVLSSPHQACELGTTDLWYKVTSHDLIFIKIFAYLCGSFSDYNKFAEIYKTTLIWVFTLICKYMYSEVLLLQQMDMRKLRRMW